jgi:hypothetical protein
MQTLRGRPWGLTLSVTYMPSFRNLDEIRSTGWRRPMSWSREVEGRCWLLPHSTGSVGSEPSHAQPIQTLRRRPWGLTFRNLDEIRSTGWRQPMSCWREVGGLCWLLPHSTGSVGSEPSHTLPIQTAMDVHGPDILSFRNLDEIRSTG